MNQQVADALASGLETHLETLRFAEENLLEANRNRLYYEATLTKSPLKERNIEPREGLRATLFYEDAEYQRLAVEEQDAQKHVNTAKNNVEVARALIRLYTWCTVFSD